MVPHGMQTMHELPSPAWLHNKHYVQQRWPAHLSFSLSPPWSRPFVIHAPLVLSRCLELLAGYPTSLEEDEAWLDGSEGQAASEAMRTAVRFRMAKKGVLAAAAEALA